MSGVGPVPSRGCVDQSNAFCSYADSLETGLEAEVENGRVARMLIKLGFINERPEFQQDPRWSDTGDRSVQSSSSSSRTYVLIRSLRW